MNAGVAVIAARSPGLAETCGDAALYIDPYAGAGRRGSCAVAASRRCVPSCCRGGERQRSSPGRRQRARTSRHIAWLRCPCHESRHRCELR